jgi:hypothetical protein
VILGTNKQTQGEIEMEKSKFTWLHLIVLLGFISFGIQALVLPAVPTGKWPNVPELGFLGLPVLLSIHMALSVIIVAGFFAFVKLRSTSD